MESFHFSQAKKILIIGAGHGIGLSLVENLLENYPSLEIFASYRNEQKAEDLKKLNAVKSFQVDPTDELKLENFSQQLKGHLFDAIIITVGVLECGDKTPEKSMRHHQLENMQRYFLINTFVTPMVAKAFRSHLNTKSPGLFATLSAKVGSLEDNQLGGWSSYRASKAALNMYLKNIALEFKQNKIPYLVLALHPGTVDTELSQNFLKTIQHKVWTRVEAAQNLIEVMNFSREPSRAYFVDYKNEEIPW